MINEPIAEDKPLVKTSRSVCNAAMVSVDQDGLSLI